ncbi:MAG: tRNA (guanosine(46)-N7)-methyltransferase TrmB [Bdellovibrionaceae bacterium]|nr:tRNA (guanosine(46)-N7)-methyltransferase TrmB [Bdellovibrionales bacterium]MCB9086342.1 tRNA (guanosine(46)-N7)-methyltransferase TrmB [Pseudobdellovibrionaceae bacterium]
MAGSAQLRVSKTKDIPNPNYYVKALGSEFASWAYDEEKAPSFKGKWRSEVFAVDEDAFLDLEIGTGNGYHFAHRAETQPERCLLGIELKYKPLIQSVRRAVNAECKNMRGMRYNARLISNLFAPGELDDVFIHFPDPWEKKRQRKHRLIQPDYMKLLFEMQRPGSTIEFKTDSRSYFDWAIEVFESCPYTLDRTSFDLHQSEYAAENFITHFERLFLRQGLPIHYARLIRS